MLRRWLEPSRCDVAADALPPRAQSLTTVALEDPAQITLSVADGGEGFVCYRAGYRPASEWQGDEVALGTEKLRRQSRQRNLPARQPAIGCSLSI